MKLPAEKRSNARSHVIFKPVNSETVGEKKFEEVESGSRGTKGA